MSQPFVLIGSLAVIGVLTVFVGKVIGPRILDWIGPGFNKATNRLDDAITGKPDDWEAKVRGIVEVRPEQLRPRLADIVPRFAKPAFPGPQPSTSLLPPSARELFEKYSQLSFDGDTHILDAAVLQPVAHKAREYVLVGMAEDDRRYYAIELQDTMAVVCLEMNEEGTVVSVEEDAPSFEHLVVLQYEMSLRET